MDAHNIVRESERSASDLKRYGSAIRVILSVYL